MEQFLDPERIAAELQILVDWFLQNVANFWSLLQVVVLLILFGIAAILGRRLRPVVAAWLERAAIPPRFAAQVGVLPAVLTPLIYLLMLWLAIGVMQQSTWPSRSYLLSVVASLLTAWVVIRLFTTFVRNPALAKTLAVCAWTIAALNITDLLDPTVALLDSLAISFGDLRVSLLTIVKGVLTLAVFLWVAAALSRFLEKRINRVSDLTPSVQVLLGKLLKITLITLAVVIALNSVG
ncbi:MAG TPA: mechanosensitive ion channel protein MscS, partial [Kiloniellaceae bacterium]|nr:mechanosensitive ion channel protein MscS [Kiloniellaceae bacterium]